MTTNHFKITYSIVCIMAILFGLVANKTLAAGNTYRSNYGWMYSWFDTSLACGTNYSVLTQASQYGTTIPADVAKTEMIINFPPNTTYTGTSTSPAGPGCFNKCTSSMLIDGTGNATYPDFGGSYNFADGCSNPANKSFKITNRFYLNPVSAGMDYQAVSPIDVWINYVPNFKMQLNNYPASIESASIHYPTSTKMFEVFDRWNGAASVSLGLKSFSGGKEIYTYVLTPTQAAAMKEGEHFWSFYAQVVMSGGRNMISSRSPLAWFGLDKTSPTIDSYVNVPANPDDSTDVTLTAAATDALSGLDTINIYLDNVLKQTCSFTGQTVQQSCSINVGKLAAKTYAYKVTATDRAKDTTGSNTNIKTVTKNIVVVAAPDTTVPTVSITSPLNNADFTTAQTVTIKADASDNVGVTKVEFYDGASLLGTDLTAPYSINWPITDLNNGSHSLWAKAFDAAGNSGTSAAMTITVSIDVASPTVSITVPAGGSSFDSAQAVNITASASDNIGVTQVDFYNGAVFLGSVAAAPYTYFWNITGADNGVHSLIAKARDAAGNIGTSAVVAVTVSIDITNPMVSITNPFDGTTFNTSQTVSIDAAATDNVGVTKVDFFDGAWKLGSDDSAPYSYSWDITGADNGAHTLTAKAYDAAGNSNTSAVIAATVDITATNLPTAIPNAPVQPDYCTTPAAAAVFSWSYDSPLPGHPQRYYQIQIIDSSGDFSVPYIDTGKVLSGSHMSTAPNQPPNPPNELQFGPVTYKWRLRVWDKDDVQSEWFNGPDFMTPVNRYPAPDFSAVPEIGYVGIPINFIDNSLDYSGGGIISRNWSFEGGVPATSTQKDPIVSFVEKGNYDISLTVTDSSGLSCTIGKQFKISRHLPEWREIAPSQ